MSTENVFLSWSKPQSLAVAQILKDWLPQVIQSVRPWMSDQDIHVGTRWSSEIASKLESIRVGIICVTPENVGEPWLNFEAGALSRHLTNGARVCPYCYGIKKSQIVGPLTQFQAGEATHGDTLLLVQSINAALGAGVSDAALSRTFEKFWPDLREQLAQIPGTESQQARRRHPNDMLEEMVDGLRSLQLQVVRLSNRQERQASAFLQRPEDAAVVAPDAAIPRTFGRYRVLKRLADAGTCEVYLAEAAGTDRPRLFAKGPGLTFVLKRLRPELAGDKQVVAQFVDVARFQASLVHANIVPVFDYGVVDGQYFSAQEHIAGHDLLELIGRCEARTGHRGLEPPLAYYLAHEVLQALAYAHDRRDADGHPLEGIHRGISARNVLVSIQGEVKLSDFGVVRSNRRIWKTEDVKVREDATFMSPEQAQGQTVDPRSDLFSLAQVLYYCLTGELMFTGDNDLEVLFKAAAGPTSGDLKRIRDLQRPASVVLEKALARDPEERFQTATEFLDVLAPHCAGGKDDLARLLRDLFPFDYDDEPTARPRHVDDR